MGAISIFLPMCSMHYTEGNTTNLVGMWQRISINPTLTLHYGGLLWYPTLCASLTDKQKSVGGTTTTHVHHSYRAEAEVWKAPINGTTNAL